MVSHILIPVHIVEKDYIAVWGETCQLGLNLTHKVQASPVFEVSISEKGEQNASGGHGIVSFLAFVWCHLLIFSLPVTPSSHCLALECSLLLYCNSDSSSPETAVYSESEHPPLLMAFPVPVSLLTTRCWKQEEQIPSVPHAFCSRAPCALDTCALWPSKAHYSRKKHFVSD